MPRYLELWAALASVVEAGRSWDVSVGQNGQLQFVPDSFNASIGDTVTYHFFAKNHSVVQSSFAQPCRPLSGGFFSGFTPTTSLSPTTFTITVNDTEPIWVYCAQANHCQQGMVHAINAPSTGNTLEQFTASAKTAPASTAPANGLPVGGQRVLHIDVGLGGNLSFSPSNVTELVGTTVQFSFNPKNHSVVQSSFADPCHPLAGGGFSSGFIPTTASPSGVLFDIVINDTNPIWFYCAQTTGTHCQKGMVGSINAPSSGNTFSAFAGLAAKASTSTIPPQAPLGGTLTVNGTFIPTLNGDVLTVTPLDDGTISWIPSPGQSGGSQYMMGLAGGGAIGNYNWAPTLSDSAATYLQLMQWLDDLLLHVLFAGFERLSAGGDWSGAYPESIVSAVGSLAAQAFIHRGTATDSLQHYNRSLAGNCTYGPAAAPASVDDFLATAQRLLLLEMGLLLDAVSELTTSDPWLIPCVATSLGAKSRAAGVLDMMQGRPASAAPREVSLPAALVHAHAAEAFSPQCSGGAQPALNASLPALQITTVDMAAGSGRAATVTVTAPALAPQGRSQQQQMYVAWLGPWGQVEYTSVGADGNAAVPTDMYGNVWAVMTNGQGAKLKDVPGITVAGPVLQWVG